METEYGVFPSEYHPFGKPRGDLILCGFACAPRGKKVPQVDVTASVGTFSKSFLVLGDRKWVKKGGKLVATPPVPFEKMAMTLKQAYGGMVETEWGEFKYIHNTQGMGFYFKEEQALDHPLPNLELPDQRVQSFEDRPVPFAPCVYPQDGGLRLEPYKDAAKPDFDREEIAHLLYNWAHPAMTVPRGFSVGDEVCFEGLNPDGPVRLRIPELKAGAYVLSGEDRVNLDFKCDTIIYETETNRITFRWRAAAQVELKPREERFIFLKKTGT